MAGPLTAVERFFERLFERPAARLFQTRLEPVQIQRSLERAMESERKVRDRRAYAPAHFRVLLNSGDLAALDGDRAALKNDLGEALRKYARSHGYTLSARPTVDIQPSSAIQQGDVRVFTDVMPFTPPDYGNGHHPADVSTAPPVPLRHEAASHENAAVPRETNVPGGIGQATAVFAAPQVSSPKAVLAIRAPQRGVVRAPVQPGSLRIGRSLDNDVVLDDDRVSRHHGQIAVRLGMLVYTDLGSTNGTFMNGSQVTEIALGPGDVLQLGSSTITIEPGS